MGSYGRRDLPKKIDFLIHEVWGYSWPYISAFSFNTIYGPHLYVLYPTNQYLGGFPSPCKMITYTNHFTQNNYQISRNYVCFTNLSDFACPMCISLDMF